MLNRRGSAATWVPLASALAHGHQQLEAREVNPSASEPLGLRRRPFGAIAAPYPLRGPPAAPGSQCALAVATTCRPGGRTMGRLQMSQMGKLIDRPNDAELPRGRLHRRLGAGDRRADELAVHFPWREADSNELADQVDA